MLSIVVLACCRHMLTGCVDVMLCRFYVGPSWHWYNLYVKTLGRL
jgi:hypothetical protein